MVASACLAVRVIEFTVTVADDDGTRRTARYRLLTGTAIRMTRGRPTRRELLDDGNGPPG